MGRSRRVALAALVCVVVLPAVDSRNSVASGRQEALTSLEGVHAEVVGEDRRSVAFVSELSAHLQESLEPWLARGSGAIPHRLLVVLVPSAQADFDGPYSVRPGTRGLVRVDLRWGPDLDLRTTCIALAEAFLTRYAIFHYGPRAPAELPAWVASALGYEGYLRLRPAVSSHLLAKVGAARSMPLAAVLGQAAGEVEAAGIQGFKLLVLMRQSGFTAATVREVIDTALGGGSIGPVLQGVLRPLQEEAEGLDPKAWWQRGGSSLNPAAGERFDSLAVSRRWLDKLADFEALAVEGETIETLRDLWKLREAAALQTMVSARLELIRMRLSRVNPAYFNAARSLGALYETVLDADYAHEFVRSLTTYLTDVEDTKRLHEAVDQALNGAPGG